MRWLRKWTFHEIMTFETSKSIRPHIMIVHFDPKNPTVPQYFSFLSLFEIITTKGEKDWRPFCSWVNIMLGGNFRTIDRPILFILVIWNRLRQRLKVIKFVCFQKHNDVKWTWQKTWFNKAEIRSRRISQNEIIDFWSRNNVGYFVSHFVLVHQVLLNFELNYARVHHLFQCWAR